MPTKERQGDRNSLVIDASPTKELFIDMLTRDVALIPAIVDLADNSTDGARRIRNDASWTGLNVEIDAKPTKFVISDNCGGIPVDVARRYAFRFGRPVDGETGSGEVGRFGVGMKRGLFKLGRKFRIESTTATTQFTATIDVDDWASDDKWEFAFDASPSEDGNFAESKQGTVISVTKLHPQVKEHFQESGFLDDLRQELTSRLEQSILKGLAVEVNSVGLKAHTRTLIGDKVLAPAKKGFKVKGPTGNSVDVELWCGLGKPESQKVSRAESGWYVFCNGRMLLEADKTAATGWGIEDEDSIPAYHPQYNGFRGLAYLDAEDAADLPWNTTKTALDTDHPVYRRVKQEIIAIARPVIDYFNKKTDENAALAQAGEEAKGTLQLLFDNATVKPLDEIKTRAFFKLPPVEAQSVRDVKKSQRIAFDRPADKAILVKNSLGVSSWREVGEEVFDYYYNAEHGDD
jgi:hypothetical protein